MEWKDSLPTCRRLAERLGVDLLVVQRKAGGMMERWEARWESSKRRYINLETVAVVLPWSTATMRFCTSELKNDVICSVLKKRWPGKKILSVTGIRAEESVNRSRAPISQVNPKLAGGLNWNAILNWTLAEVLEYCKEQDFLLHEAYRIYGSTRVSCVFCILAAGRDLIAGATCKDNQGIYCRMCDLELDSTFAFREKSWLSDLRPDLLTWQQRMLLPLAKKGAGTRQALEFRIPKHMRYVKGWPTALPTQAEAEMLADVRKRMEDIISVDCKYTTAGDVIARYQELMDIQQLKKRNAITI